MLYQRLEVRCEGLTWPWRWCSPRLTRACGAWRVSRGSGRGGGPRWATADRGTCRCSPAPAARASGGHAGAGRSCWEDWERERIRSDRGNGPWARAASDTSELWIDNCNKWIIIEELVFDRSVSLRAGSRAQIPDCVCALGGWTHLAGSGPGSESARCVPPLRRDVSKQTKKETKTNKQRAAERWRAGEKSRDKLVLSPITWRQVNLKENCFRWQISSRQNKSFRRSYLKNRKSQTDAQLLK